jgi:hypothetical protein
MTNLNPTPRPSQRTGAALVSNRDAGAERLYLFGGNATLAGTNNQTWRYDVTANAWTQEMTTASPPARAWHSMSWDPQHQRVLLFGGSRDLNGPLLNDAWLFDPSTLGWQQLDAGAVGPSPRFLASMVYDPGQQAHLLVGGGTSTSANAEATALSPEVWRGVVNPAGSSIAWTAVPAPSGPPARASACVGFDPQRRRLFVFGGEVVNDTLGDLWVLDVATTTWAPLTAPGAPSKRGSSVCTWDERARKLVVHGGVSQPSGTPLSESFTFEPETNVWQRVTPSPSAGALTFAAATFSVQSGALAFFGGRSSLIGVSQATWTFRVNAAPVLPTGVFVVTPEGTTLGAPPLGPIDADGDPLTVSWNQVSGPAVSIMNGSSLMRRSRCRASPRRRWPSSACR